jgi:CRISPR-associated endonuclease/helicase Cas3
MEAILEARRDLREKAARLLGLEPNEATKLLVTLAALHDIGKFSRGFQAMVPEFWPAALGELPTSGIARTPHTRDGYLLWRDQLGAELAEVIWPEGSAVLRRLAKGIFGHHGRPVADESVPVEVLFGRTGIEAARACALDLCELLSPEPCSGPPLSRKQAMVASYWISGLTTIADWVGSRQGWFPYCSPHTGEGLASYLERARSLARHAIGAAGLLAATPSPCRSFVELTGRSSPTPAQTWAESVPLPPGPLLVLLEDSTGSGKTEAAQMLVHRLMSAGRASGAYWAMPTQATANAMYERQRTAIGRLYDTRGSSIRPSLVLAHGQAMHHEGFRATVLAFDRVASEAVGCVDDPGEPDGALSCSAFLADDRRASLLADIGAGTIDQAVLASLPTRFATVRQLGLSTKVLILDEAHAYDAYVGQEILALLRFQAAFGGCAIVLSATLSLRQRQDLVAAWRHGLGVERADCDWGTDLKAASVTSMEYPLATVVSGPSGSVTEVPITAAPGSVRRIPVRFVTQKEEVLEEIARAASAGAAVAWIRNTVDACLAGARLLRERGVDATVFHARFAQADRQAREREVLSVFGPGGDAAERRGQVLVATQVIEQSLDLDFDFLVTDLAPIDLLIQRAGRLRRHRDRDRERPVGIPPELVVVAPEFRDDPSPHWLDALLPGTAWVYDDPGVLWRTYRTLLESPVIASPDSIRWLIEAVYANDEVPSALASEVARADGERRAAAAAGHYASLDPFTGYDGNSRGWMDDLHASTRLGDDRVPVRLARVCTDGELVPWADDCEPPWRAWALSEVSVSTRRAPPGHSPPARFQQAIDGVRSGWGRFDRDIQIIPLEPADGDEWHGELAAADGRARIVYRYNRRDGLSFGS